MTAPAPAPIAASRLVFFCTVVVGVLALVEVPLLAVLLPLVWDGAALDLWVVLLDADLGALAVAVPERMADVPVALFVLGGGHGIQRRVRLCGETQVAVERRVGRLVLAARGVEHEAGARINTLSPAFITPPGFVGLRRAGQPARYGQSPCRARPVQINARITSKSLCGESRNIRGDRQGCG